jgi:hypothetical protein
MKMLSTRRVLVLQLGENTAQQKSGLPSASLGKVTVGRGAMVDVKEALGPNGLKLAPASVLYSHPTENTLLPDPRRARPPQVRLANPRADVQNM